mmetsp:Transcript_4759/g.12499  ORF Transcript_4759/g.12499 Transcript_4759/m.12499 type:complete len:257 (+) Transcript_4759:143-913(+)
MQIEVQDIIEWSRALIVSWKMEWDEVEEMNLNGGHSGHCAHGRCSCRTVRRTTACSVVAINSVRLVSRASFCAAAAAAFFDVDICNVVNHLHNNDIIILAAVILLLLRIIVFILFVFFVVGITFQDGYEHLLHLLVHARRQLDDVRRVELEGVVLLFLRCGLEEEVGQGLAVMRYDGHDVPQPAFDVGTVGHEHVVKHGEAAAHKGGGDEVAGHDRRQFRNVDERQRGHGKILGTLECAAAAVGTSADGVPPDQVG